MNMNKSTCIQLGLIGLLLFLSSCVSTIPTPSLLEKPAALQLVSSEQWPDLADDLDYKELEQTVVQSLAYLRNRPREQTFLFGTRKVYTDDLAATLDLFLKIIKDETEGKDREQKIRTHFDLYRMVQNDTPLSLLVTGYYEPTLPGSRTPSTRFRYPVYKLPEDLVFIHPEKFSAKIPPQKWIGRIEGTQVLPYYTRQEIDQEGLLEGKHLEILWVDDPLKLFFLHIQGSGEVSLENGSFVKLGYHGANGHPYFSIGRELIRREILRPDEVSLQSIYQYLQDHPLERQALMNLNPSYIFFKENRGGPYGSLGRPLTPGRSAAMDLKIFPPGGLAWLKGVLPAADKQGRILSRIPLGRWVSLQDSGGAIKGPARLDLFLGKGSNAELIAGHLRHPGDIYILLKK
jgi:membrane-bound lytic murein transglycosylase A